MKPTTKSVTIDGITFTGTFTPADPGRYYMRNGDPGYPPEPAEFDVEKIEGSRMDLVELLNGKIPDTKKTPQRVDLWEIINEICLEKIGDE